MDFANDDELSTWIAAKLVADLGELGGPRFATAKPMLAHYTSMSVVGQILTEREIWFSNPLFMNDYAEVVAGLRMGIQGVLKTDKFDEILYPEELSRFRDAMQYYRNEWANTHLLDVFVFSTSLIDARDNDGELSMWRGYGGDGSGAAIVFDAAKLAVAENSPLIVSEVTYMSVEEQQLEVDRLCQFMADVLREAQPSQEQLALVAYWFFERIKVFALLTKHRGFREEKEWRVIYLPERDEGDVIKKMISQTVGAIVQPKLKFSVDQWAQSRDSATRLLDLVDRIILGPALSSDIYRIGLMRMLKDVAPELENKVFVSSIPYRQKFG